MWVGRESATGVRLLLTEAIKLAFVQTSLKECAGIHTGRGVTLHEDLVATTGVVLAAEEVVETDFIQR